MTRWQSWRHNKYVVCFVFVLFVAPIILSWASWPFNSIPDRQAVKSPDRIFLQSLNSLDRVDNVEYAGRADLTDDEKDKLISMHSNKSLKWAMPAYPPSMVSFMHHFMPTEMFEYLSVMYKDDENFSRCYQSRVYFSPNDNNLFHLLGVDYFFSELDRYSYPFVLVGRYGDYYLYRNEKVFPRFYFVDEIRVVEQKNKWLSELYDTPYEQLRKTAFVYGANRRLLSPFTPSKLRYIGLITYSPNVVIVETRSPSEQYMVLTDTYDDRWKVYIDGERHSVYRTNYLFRGVRIPAGEHSVQFVYEYEEFKYYLFVAMASALAIAYAIFSVRMKVPQ